MNYKHLSAVVKGMAIKGAFTLALMSSTAFIGNAHAKSPEINFSGFVNIALTYADDDRYGFRSQILNRGRDGLSFAPDSLLGLQSNIEFNSGFDAVVQVVLQDRVDDSFTNYLELAFLRYQISRNWSVKVGRFSTNSYLFTDFRYVGQASYWMRPPVEMYSTVGSLGNMNGAKFNYTRSTNFGSAKLSASFGESELQNDGDNGIFRISYQDLVVLNLELQSENWQVQAAYLSANLNDFEFAQLTDIQSAEQAAPAPLAPFFSRASAALIPGGERVSYFSLSGRYFWDNVEFISEYGNYDSQWALASASQFGYVSLAYNTESLTPYITLARTNRENEPEIIQEQELVNALPPQLVGFASDLLSPLNEAAIGASVDQDAISLGLRWDIHERWALKFQYNHFKINEKGSGLFSVNDGGLTPREKTSYNVVSIGATTTF